jgi:hypothetical protein
MPATSFDGLGRCSCPRRLSSSIIVISVVGMMCELLLEDAFVGGVDAGPSTDLGMIEPELPMSGDGRWGTPPAPRKAFTPRQGFLRTLMASADKLREDFNPRKPYWSQRKNANSTHRVRFESTVRQYVALVRDLVHAATSRGPSVRTVLTSRHRLIRLTLSNTRSAPATCGH